MKTRSFARGSSKLGLAALVIAGAASAADVHVMISAGFYGVYSELGPAFERASGHRLHTTRGPSMGEDRKSTRLNSSHSQISYAVFCLKKKKKRPKKKCQ